MNPAATNSRARKASILIPILVVVPLMGLGLYIAPNLLDTTPLTLTVRGMVVNGVAVAPEEWTERDFSSPVSAQLSLPSGGQR